MATALQYQTEPTQEVSLYNPDTPVILTVNELWTLNDLRFKRKIGPIGRLSTNAVCPRAVLQGAGFPVHEERFRNFEIASDGALSYLSFVSGHRAGNLLHPATFTGWFRALRTVFPVTIVANDHGPTADDAYHRERIRGLTG